MAYTPINWQNGDTITAEKLNKMDNGWSYSSSSTEICNESVTTADDGYGVYAGQLSVSSITADTIVVTYDGNEYTCDYIDETYGATFDESTEQFDWSTYPFAIYNDGFVMTQTSGLHTFVIVAEGTPTIETSKEFRSAVGSFVDTSTMPMECVHNVTTLQEMNQAYTNGRILFFKPFGNSVATISFISSFTQSSVNFIPESSSYSARIDNGIFKVGIN